ncbi:polysaccharide biosynthesis tyrosine autokinase [Kocuria sp. M1R5S2]|uniref:polysaccharide biosynthesis tyrosine autokinase n=1 Tax=Kocuria rhizosphaerae TaxID=3376285 RepID=UPI0037A649AC
MTVLDFLRLTRANLPLLLAGLLLGVLAAYAFSLTVPKVYTSTSTGYVNVASSDEGVDEVVSGSQAAQNRATAYVPLVASRPVAEEIAERSDSVDSADQIMGRLTATVVPGSALMQVTAMSSTPEEARDLANASLVATAAVVGELEGRDSPVEVIPLGDAQLPTQPASPDIQKYFLAGAVLGLVLAYAVAFLRKAADVKVRTTADVETAAGVGVLGVLPKDPSLKDDNRRTSALEGRAAEAIRQLRTNLRFVSVDAPPRTILITSARSEEGKSTVSTTMARALARAGEPVLLVDADLRRPTVAEVFGIDGSVGLTQMITGQIAFEAAVKQVDEDGLFVLPAGRIPPDPSELLGSSRMRELIRGFRKDFTVIIDAAPLLPVTDASLLSTAVDGVVLVVKAGETRKEHVRVAREMVRKVNGKVLGVVLNQVPTGGLTSHYYGYGYGAYESYYHQPGRTGKSKRPQPGARGKRRAGAGTVNGPAPHGETRSDPVMTSQQGNS